MFLGEFNVLRKFDGNNLQIDIFLILITPRNELKVILGTSSLRYKAKLHSHTKNY
jgi:hypothetical protein